MENKEFEYQLTMYFARKFLRDGVISKEQYRAFNSIMLEKYAPKTGDLFTDIDLI